MFVRYPPARIRYEADRPAALLKVRIAPSHRLVDLPLATPTTSARTGRGTWAQYPLGAEVVEGPGLSEQVPVVRDAAGPAQHPAADRDGPSRRARRGRAGAGP